MDTARVGLTWRKKEAAVAGGAMDQMGLGWGLGNTGVSMLRGEAARKGAAQSSQEMASASRKHSPVPRTPGEQW